MGHITRLPKLLIYVALLGVISVCILFVFAQRDVLARHLHAWKVLPRPERLTELYFTRPDNLPTTFSPGVSQTLTFTIHNLEQQTTEYRYILTAARDTDNEQTLSQGHLSLANGASQDITQTIKIPRSANRLKIKVRLEYSGLAFGQDKPSQKTQSIHYWVTTADKTVKERGT